MESRSSDLWSITKHSPIRSPPTTSTVLVAPDLNSSILLGNLSVTDLATNEKSNVEANENINELIEFFGGNLRTWNSADGEFEALSPADLEIESPEVIVVEFIKSNNFADKHFIRLMRQLKDSARRDCKWIISLRSWRLTNGCMNALKSLKIDSLDSWSTKISFAEMGTMLQGFNIRRWNPSGAATNADLIAAAKYLPMLEELTIQCGDGEPNRAGGPVASGIAALAEAKNLKSLTIYNFDNPVPEFGADRISSLMKLTQLDRLLISEFADLDKETLAKLRRSLPNTRISLSKAD